jgi:hypothetical protein
MMRVAACCILLGALWPILAGAEVYPAGLIPLADELREGLPIEWVDAADVVQKAKAAPRTRPTACANTLHLPAVRSQLLSSCGAYAPSYYYKTYQEARERGWVRPDPNINPERVMSPGFTFPLTNRGENNGAGIATVMGVICRYGIATWKDMPENLNWWTYPADDIWAKSLPYRGDRVIGFNLATNDGLEAMKQHLADGDLGVFAAPVSANFRDYPHGDGVDNDVLFANAEIYDLHALTLVGYDDTRTYHDGSFLKTGAFLAVNSWGPGWGVEEPGAGTAGFCWLGYDYMRTNRAGDSSVLAMIDRTNYIPRKTARIELSHDARNDLQLSMSAGNGFWSTNELEVFPRGGGRLPYHGTITVDVTEFEADRPEIYHLFAIDWAGIHHSPEAGTIRSFEVHKRDGVVMVCSNVPVTLMNSDPEEYPNWHVTRLQLGTLEEESRPVWEEPLQTPVFSWIDFNADGADDLVVFGTYESTNNLAALFVNNGQGGFSRRHFNLPRLHSVRMAWGDYNNDGYSDLAVSGRTAEMEPQLLLLRNIGGDGIEDSGISFSPEATTLAWGDLDQDGDLDLATGSGNVFRNAGGTNFVNTGITPLGGDSSFYTTVAWADLNNDGLHDLIINGAINVNTGGAFGGPFHLDPLNPPRVGGDARFFHDFNQDGLLDAAGNGWINYDMGVAADWDNPDIWRTWYEPSTNVFPDWAWPVIDAADFNCDGLLDMAMSGAVGSSADVRFSVFRQETNRYQLPDVPETWAVQAFTDIGLRRDGFYSGGAGWTDWDGDGDLDLLAGGMDSSFEPQLAMLANRLADRGKPNQPPQAPQRFRTTQTNENVVLQWHPATDDRTPETSMAYEVRVGCFPGRCNVVSPFGLGPLPGNARLIGDLSLPQDPVYWPRLKNTNGLPGIRLRNLPPGRYYWSVRAVDSGRVRSNWSAEQSFTVTAAGLRNGDINQDGHVDVADLVRGRKMVAGDIPAVIETADLNFDGSVDEADLAVLENRLLHMESDGYVPVAEAVIGPAGGVLSNGSFSLTVPPGAFSGTETLKLLTTGDDRWFGEDSPRVMWRVQGLPASLTGNLTFSGPDHRVSPTSQVVMALGQWVRPHGVNVDSLEPVRTFSAVTGTVSGGRLVAQVPASLLHGAGTASAGPVLASSRKSSTPDIRFDVDSGWFTDSHFVKTPHFEIRWESSLPPTYLASLAQTLEEAFIKYQAMNFPFVDKRDWTNHPVQIWLRPLKDEGGEVHTSDDGAYVELNVERMKNAELRNTTAYHEFFHLVQGLVNPAYSITEARDMNLLLLSEATSTWMERFGADNPDTYVPSNYSEDQLRIFDGLSYGARRNASKSGYAFSSLIEYLTGRFGEGIVRTLYNRIIAGDNALTAIFNSVPDPGDRSWHHDYYRAVAANEVYPGTPLINLTRAATPAWPPPDQTYTATTNQFPMKTFGVLLPGLGADGWRFAFTPAVVAALSNSSTLVFSLDNPRQDLEMSVVSAQVQADPPATVTVESYGALPTRIRQRVLSLQAALPEPSKPQIPWRSFVAVVSRLDLADPDTYKWSDLKIALANRLVGNYPLPNFTHGQLWWNGENTGFPVFDCTASLYMFDLTGLFKGQVFQTDPGVNSAFAFLSVFQDGQIEFNLHFSANQTGATSQDVMEPGTTNRFTRFIFKSKDGYRIYKRLYNGPALEDQPYVFEPRPFSGAETLTLEADEDNVYFGVSVLFTVECQDFRDGFPIGSPFTFDLWTSPMVFHVKRE